MTEQSTQSTTIISFSPQPIAEQSGSDCSNLVQQSLLFLWQQAQENRLRVVHQKIGNGVGQFFRFDVPFKIISWRITNNNSLVVTPDCRLNDGKLTVIFGVPPAVDEFNIEILGMVE